MVSAPRATRPGPMAYAMPHATRARLTRARTCVWAMQQWLRDALTQAIEEERAVVSGESKQAAGGAGAAASADGGDSAPAGYVTAV